jgi:hypothetical protein
MRQIISSVLPMLLLVIFFIVPVYVLIWTRRFRHGKRRSPLTAKLLRGPGETLRRELDDLMLDFSAYLGVLLMMPFLIYSIHLSQMHYGELPDTVGRWIFQGFLAVVITGSLLVKLIRLARLRFNLQHGLEAEIAMGQELDQLMRQGAVVYHDFPAEKFNIDHVVMTSNGVYAVETKGRMKPDRGGGKKDAQVYFDGKVLSFPDWKDSKTLDQALRQAQWLAKWISSAVGEAVTVKPVVALPGWWVERKGRGDVMVISGKEAAALLNSKKGNMLSQQLMQRIEHQLEARCRDVEPSHYGKQERFGRSVN